MVSSFGIVLTCQGNQIKDEGATALADMLKANSTLTKIILRGEWFWSLSLAKGIKLKKKEQLHLLTC